MFKMNPMGPITEIPKTVSKILFRQKVLELSKRWRGPCQLLLFLLISVGSVFAVEQTVVLQFGQDGYVGSADTWVSRQYWGTPRQHTVNYGQNENLLLMRNGRENTLLVYDLSSIPANSLILNATLDLYNETASSGSATIYERRVLLFQVLRDWDEGNQSNSPIDASGKHGATGDHAFDFFTGEGTDIAWNERGMQAGTDYASIENCYSDIADEGWYQWDITELVRPWVRNEVPNYGMVLRDATGYEDGHTDSRSFRSSQYPDADFRPKLTIRYNPDVPFAAAGNDIEILDWDGTAINLNGSASQDRPGGNNASLTYSWEIISASYGSNLSGVIGTDALLAFQPDVAGEWEFQLTVTNEILEVASDRVIVRVLSIPTDHPRIYLTPQKLALLQARAVAGNFRWTQLVAEAGSTDGPMHAKALVGLITNDDNLCDQAVAAAIDLMNSPGDWSTKSGDIALVFDWCFHRLNSGQITDFINYFNDWGQDQLDSPFSSDAPGWGNYWPRYGYSFAMIGLATNGHNARAQEWFDQFRISRFKRNDLSMLDRIASGGGWPEGMIYDWIANPPRIRALEAWFTATGENLFLSTSWFRERLPYMLLHRWPGIDSEWGYEYHPYASIGDTERNRGAIGNYERIMALILVERFPDETITPQLQAYLSQGTTNNSDDFLFHDEFLWYNPDQSQEDPSLKTHYAPGTGTVFMRSGWPSGSQDTDTDVTHITFQCGDHFSYHQHYDQNSFTLFKHDDLLLDSGVYSGDGLSYHDRDYYVRTIAHNSLVVYNPNEDFSASRPDATTVDGGQRSMYPASRAPQNTEYFGQHDAQYETGDMLHFEDHADYTYVLGDATAAYNNPNYNQAMNTTLTGNIAKLTRFYRSMVYLRPNQQYAAEDDFLVLFDRVGVTQASYSGANTKLLFHLMNDPEVNGSAQVVSPGETLYFQANEVTAFNGSGQLRIRSVWPQTVNMRKVGGRAEKAFWVFDQNVDWHWSFDEAQPRPISDFENRPYGEWRIEIEPSDTALDHNFLTVLMPTSYSDLVFPSTLPVQSSNMQGVHIVDNQLNRLCLFSSAYNGSSPVGAISYSYIPTAETLHLVFDLTPDQRYSLTVSYPAGETMITLTPDENGDKLASSQGVLRFYVNNDADGDDINPPYTSDHDPARNAVNVPVDSNVTVHVQDGGDGVNQSSIVMTVNSQIVIPSITGTPADYILTYSPPAPFGYDEVVNVTIDAEDLSNPANVMTQDAYSFTTEFSVNNAPDGAIDAPTEDMTIDVGGSVDFAGTYSDPDGDSPQSFNWTFGPDSGIPDSDQENPGLKQFNNPGSFIVTFTVVDSLGLTDPTPDTRTITVTDGSVFLTDDFSDGNMYGWSVIDEGGNNGPSNWNVQNGRLRQSSNIYGPGAGATGNRKGTFAYWNDPAALFWIDYTFDVTIKSTDNDGIGVMFRYQDQLNYYKYEIDKQRNFHKLFKIINGTETTLATVSAGYTQYVDMGLQVEVSGDQINIKLDGTNVFGGSISDSDLTAGTIALYSWGNKNSIYGNVLVNSFF